MPSKEDLKRRAAEIIDAKADDLTAIAKTILKNPEPGFREQAVAVIPMGRLAEPRDLMATIILLLADGGAFITGQTIYVDGGLWSKAQWPY